MDEDGNAVESWTAIKASNSYKYYVYNADTSSWDVSKYLLNQTSEGCIMKTAGLLYGSSSVQDSYDVYAGIYNDEPANGDSVSSTYAHAKGILAASESNGAFWMVHSMPLWPDEMLDDSNPGVFPSMTYAQSLTCVTVAAKTADSIAANLMIDRPYIYSSVISEDSSLESAMPNMFAWLNGNHTTDPTSNYFEFKGVDDDVTYTQFAKSKDWGKDLWDDLVAPTLASPLNVETWRSGSGGRMSSICGPQDVPKGDTYELYDVFEIASIEMPDGDNWIGTQDHSKWASTAKSPNQIQVSCVGDINRMCSQETRGGGALCSDDAARWAAFDSIITAEEACDLYNPCAPYQNSTQCYWCSPSDD